MKNIINRRGSFLFNPTLHPLLAPNMFVCVAVYARWARGLYYFRMTTRRTAYCEIIFTMVVSAKHPLESHHRIALLSE